MYLHQMYIMYEKMKKINTVTFLRNNVSFMYLCLWFYCRFLPYSHLDLMNTSYSSLSDSTRTVGQRMYDRVLSLSSKSCTRRVSFATAFLSCVFSSKSFISSESLIESPGRKGTGCLECNSLKSNQKQHIIINKQYSSSGLSKSTYMYE